MRGLITLLCWILIRFAVMADCFAQAGTTSLFISEVAIDRDVFNPSLGQSVTIRFRISKNARVSLNIFDFDQELIVSLLGGKSLNAGQHAYPWNGRDWNGKIVPDEAYFFTIEANNGAERSSYDPAGLTDSILREIEGISILPDRQELEYALPEKGRVAVKAGIVDGPLLALPVDWEPRTKGTHREHWDGMDQDGLISVLKHPRYQIRGSYFSLPDTSIFSTGNKTITYVRYKQANRDRKAKRAITAAKEPKSILAAPLHDAGVLFSKTLPLDLTFPRSNSEDAEGPVFGHFLPIRVDLPEKWKGLFASKQSEIYFFLDVAYQYEEPGVRLPYETVFDVSKYGSGEHIISVNLISSAGQIAIKSKKIRIR